jgi:hypothetical protein
MSSAEKGKSEAAKTSDLQRFLLLNAACCLRCSYDLHGLGTSGASRCPECGAELTAPLLQDAQDSEDMCRIGAPPRCLPDCTNEASSQGFLIESLFVLVFGHGVLWLVVWSRLAELTSLPFFRVALGALVLTTLLLVSAGIASWWRKARGTFGMCWSW